MAEIFEPMDHVEKPWGTYDVVYRSATVRVKVLTIKPGARLSDQRHSHRAEHWFVAEGAGQLELEYPDGRMETIILEKGTRVQFGPGVWHRLSVPAEATRNLQIVEVWEGTELSEDDIERRADDYGRV